MVIILQALNDILYLVAEGEDRLNAEGFLDGEAAAEERKEIFCSRLSVKRSEYYAAMREGVKVSQVFKVCSLDYSREKLLEYDGSRYKVERIYQTSENYLELVCSEVQ